MLPTLADYCSTLNPFFPSHNSQSEPPPPLPPSPKPHQTFAKPFIRIQSHPKWWVKDREKLARSTEKHTQTSSQSTSQCLPKTQTTRGRRKSWTISSARRRNPKHPIMTQTNPAERGLRSTLLESLGWSLVRLVLFAKLKSILPNIALRKLNGKGTRYGFFYKFCFFLGFLYLGVSLIEEKKWLSYWLSCGIKLGMITMFKFLSEFHFDSISHGVCDWIKKSGLCFVLW